MRLLCSLLLMLSQTALLCAQDPSAYATITAYIQKELGTQVRLVPPHNQKATLPPLPIESITCQPSSQTFVVTFHNPSNKPTTHKGRFVFQENVPVLKKSLKRGARVDASHITWQLCDSSKKTRGALNPDTWQERLVTRDLPAGTILNETNSKQRNNIQRMPRGTSVMVEYHKPPLIIQAHGGRLQQAACVGSIVKVTSPFAGKGKSSLQGRLVSANKVIIGKCA